MNQYLNHSRIHGNIADKKKQKYHQNITSYVAPSKISPMAHTKDPSGISTITNLTKQKDGPRTRYSDVVYRINYLILSKILLIQRDTIFDLEISRPGIQITNPSQVRKLYNYTLLLYTLKWVSKFCFLRLSLKIKISKLSLILVHSSHFLANNIFSHE